MITKDKIDKKVELIEELISQSSLDKAFTELRSFVRELDDKELRKTVVTVKQTYTALKNEERDGTVDDSTKRTNKNKISKRLLDTLYEAETVALDLAQEKEEIIPQPSTPTKSPIISSKVKPSINKLELLKHETSEQLNHKTTADEFAEYSDLRDKILESHFSELKDKLIKTPHLNEFYADELFEKILYSGRLTTVDKIKIEELRSELDEKQGLDTKLYKWYQRSQVVSALTLSFGRGRKIDVTRLNLLIDFVTDKEPKVWRRALVGLVLGLHRFQHKIKSYEHICKRLVALQYDMEVQEGLYIIDLILRQEWYKKTLSSKHFFTFDFFEKPQKWFLPFYQGNKIYKNALENADENMDIGSLEMFIQFPFVSSIKYAFCLAVEQSKMKFNDKGTNTPDEKFMNTLASKLYLQPYHNYITELYNFYCFFPRHELQNIFDKKVMLYNSKLSNIILSRVQKIKIKGLVLFEEKKYSLALSQFLQYQKIIDAEDVDITVRIGECFLQQNDYLNALKYFKKARVLQPKSYRLLKHIGNCYQELDMLSKALEFYLSIADKFDKELWWLIGKCYVDLEKYENALTYFLEIEKLNDNEEELLFQIAYCNSFLEEYSTAIRYYTEAIHINPKGQGYFNNRGNSYSHLKEYEKAIEDYTEAIRINAKDDRCFNNRGTSYFNLKEYEKAIKDYTKAIRINAKKDLYFHNRGDAHYKLKEYEKAIKEYNKAIELNSKNDDYFNSKAIALYRLKKYREGMVEINKAINLDNQHSSYYSNRACLYIALREYDKAKEDIQQALKLNVNNGYAYGLEALMLADNGEIEQFYDKLEKAITQSKPYRLSEQLEVEETLQKFKDEPRFKVLLEKSDEILKQNDS